MARSNRDVYRGRRTATDILRLIAIVLAVLVVLAVAGAFCLQKYLVYTDDGVRLELPPFLQSLRGEAPGGGSAVPPVPGDVSVVVDPDGSRSEPEEPEKPGFAVQVPLSRALDGTAAAQLEQSGAQALILEMKDPGGKLGWYSGQREAERSEANAPQANNEALKRLNAGEAYTIARVCCFRDDSAPYFHNKQALRRGQYNWRDELGLRWLSPANEDAQAYLAALCGELGELGFDEIVLEQFYFPVRGNQENINRGEDYDPAAFPEAVEAFLTRVRTALEPYGTRLSLRLDGEVLGEGSALSGVTAETVNRYAWRLWSEPEGRTALAASGELSVEAVEIVPAAAEDADRFQAVLPPEE